MRAILASLAVLCLVFSAAARPQAAATIYANVRIDRIGHERLAELKRLPGLEWWVELDEELLVCGDARTVKALSSGYSFRIVARDANPDELCILQGRGARRAGARVLASGGRSAVLLATPAERARLEHDGHDDEQTPHAHNLIAPFMPNAVLARQAANEPPRDGASTATFNVAIQAMVDSVDGARWRSDVQTLGGFNRYTRGTGITAARNWLVDQFEAHFPAGPPSLVQCLGLSVRGDVTFGRGVVCRDDVVVEGSGTIPDHTVLEGSHSAM